MVNSRSSTSAQGPPGWSISGWYREMQSGWDQFWFRPAGGSTLSVMRILTGLMLCYNHAVWGTKLTTFLGRNSWISADVSQALARDSYAWSFLWYVESPLALWSIHLAGILVFILFVVGWKTQQMSVLAWIITINYCHRLQGVLFGFDQVLAILTMYLMLGNCGERYSIDAWLAGKRAINSGERAGGSIPLARNNLATRLLQSHLCVIYLFGGLAKVRGETWWDGSAMWNAIANLEYQSLDVTWLGKAPWLLAMLALMIVFWETFYCALIWSRWARPLVLGFAVLTHAGIGIALGMQTFGLAMLALNCCFISPETTDRWIGRLGKK
jgi:hypothetical protein